MLSILSTNLCPQPTNIQRSPAILYLKSLQRPCCPMARPDALNRDIGLDEGDINPKEKSLIDHAIEAISTRKSKDLLFDDISFNSEKPPTALDRAKIYILVIRAECMKCMQDVAIRAPRQECLLAEVAGTITGWVSAVIVVRVGKVAAFGLGGGIILLHVASECGYISVNWERIRGACAQTQHWVDYVIRFVKRNSCYSVGFMGGFFFGIAST